MQTAIKCAIKKGRLGESEEITNLEEPGNDSNVRIRKLWVTKEDRTNYKKKESEEGWRDTVAGTSGTERKMGDWRKEEITRSVCRRRCGDITCSGVTRGCVWACSARLFPKVPGWWTKQEQKVHLGAITVISKVLKCFCVACTTNIIYRNRITHTHTHSEL